jgi:hypothetical protein
MAILIYLLSTVFDCYFMDVSKAVFFCFIAESFALCKTYCPLSQYMPNVNTTVLPVAGLSVPDHPPVPFKACGSEMGYDSDTNYPLQVCGNYEHRDWSGSG